MPREIPESVDCLHCGKVIKDTDAWTFTRHIGSPKGIAAIHVACSASGVERWCREGQPHGSPIEAARVEHWLFTREAEGTHPYGRPGHTVRNRLHDAREGRVEHAPDPIDS